MSIVKNFVPFIIQKKTLKIPDTITTNICSYSYCLSYSGIMSNLTTGTPNWSLPLLLSGLTSHKKYVRKYSTNNIDSAELKIKRKLLKSRAEPLYMYRFTEKLALEHINSDNLTTHLVINKLLYNQKVSISANKLKELLKIKGIEFALPISKSNLNKFYCLVGKSKHTGYAGVYVFTHKSSKSMYIGSSNLLRRRMEYYFKGNYKIRGKFLPLLSNEGLSSFNIKVFKLDNNIFKPQDALFLEQYMLLNKHYDLNTLRVVNFGPSEGKAIYVYNLDCTILYYHAQTQIGLKRVLGIHQSSCKKYLDSNIPYLNQFILLSFPVSNIIASSIEVKQLKMIMDKERRISYELGNRRSLAVTLEIRQGNTYVDPAYFPASNNKLAFDSLTSCTGYLQSIGLTIKRDTLSKYIKLGKVFHNFYCKYLDSSYHVNSVRSGKEQENLGLLIEEYKKNRISREAMEEVNKKNKPFRVKSILDSREQSFLSITDTILYFETQGVKLDRKMLYICLKKGGTYKGFTFHYLQK